MDLNDTASAGYQRTPEELRRAFVTHARDVEQRLISLSQEIYNEIAAVHDQTPPTHSEIAARIKKVLDEGLPGMSADHLAAHALAADRAWGYSVPEQGDKQSLPHT